MQTLKAPEKVVVYNRNSYKFVVFGCGGTGSYFVRDLFRIVGVYNRQYNRNDTILLIDADTVEEHNLARQNFIRPDVGKNKAQVLAERYGAAFGVNVGFIPHYLKADNFSLIIDQLQSCIPVFVGCVDNNKTRCLIHDLYRRVGRNGAIYLDSGNEEFAGQVVFSCTNAFTTNGYYMSLANSTAIRNGAVKDVVELFELTPDDRHPDDLSCAERAVHAPQNIATNMMAAQVLFDYCNTILCASAALARLDQPDIVAFADAHKDARAISSHVMYFNSRTGLITAHNFEEGVSSYIEANRRQRETWLDAERARRNPKPEVAAVIAEEPVQEESPAVTEEPAAVRFTAHYPGF